MTGTAGPSTPFPPKTQPRAGSIAGNESVAGDADTCRICRGEGTASEPLFYPCKCSGSIKYVHQDCLMEWLSHSQKKHCELCKTPFRFTKLYDPDMPKRLPAHIFLSHMAKYLFRNLLVWLRAALVISVWLGWLPYLMRTAWSFLFWISDDGFGPSTPASPNVTAAYQDIVNFGINSLGMTSDVCPSSPLTAATTCAPGKQLVAETMPQFFKGLATWLKLNATARSAHPAAARSLLTSSPDVVEQAASLGNLTHVAKDMASATLLSDVPFLKNLTRQPALNRIIIYVLEGQIITVLVIISFILIILVRDYVVQQQPEINMRAAFAAQANNVEGDVQEPQEPQAQPVRIIPAPEVLDFETDEDDNEVEETATDNGAEMPAEDNHMAADPVEPHQRPIAGFRRRLGRRDNPDENTALEAGGTSISDRESLDRLFSTPLDDQSLTTVNQYLRIYREADGDRDRILDIIRNEGLEERLQYWVNITQTASRGSNTAPFAADRGPTSQSAGPVEASSSYSNPFASSPPAHHQVGINGADWALNRTELTAEDKGKGRATDDDESEATNSDVMSQIWPDMERRWRERSNESAFPPSPSRPRAVSDGPPLHSTINPLANNSWSFSNLPPTAEPETSAPIPSQSPLWNTQEPEVSSVRGEAAGQDDADAGSWVDIPDGEEAATEDLTEHLIDDGEVQAAGQPRTLVDRVADFMFGGIEADAQAPNDIELFLDDQNAPFLPNGEGNPDEDVADDLLDAGADLAPDAIAAAGMDPDAIDDAEDFDGVMELIGMRGPVAGLFQNAIFCAFLVSITIFLGVFVPYNVGRLTVWIVANPMRLVRMVFSFSKLIQDLCLFAVGWTSSMLFDCLYFASKILRMKQAYEFLGNASSDAKTLTFESVQRLWDSLLFETTFISSNEIRNFSVVSHEALINVKDHTRLLLKGLADAIEFLFSGDVLSKWAAIQNFSVNNVPHAMDWLKNITIKPGSWVISVSIPDTTSTFDPSLAFWSAKDRTLAILAGYISLSFAAALYLGRGTPFSANRAAQEWEASVIDALNQASGVMKVILIISIEMLIFPLYCGLLLDAALLPLFEGTSFRSRLYFTYNYPMTSIFVHWFVGTGYMFHFALFVSMCRKIMRKGVLYFIRDPDDPEFHPVRDVLERNVTTQLRKILFSAFVYGALVVICLGGVVWGLSFTLPNVLPIHYSSNEPVLEFPIDLLFYNFLMPLAVKFFKPSDGLHAMYTWWFRRCARGLRLTWFLFGERRIDEEGVLRLASDSRHNGLPWYRKLLLEVPNSHKAAPGSELEVAPKTWVDLFDDGKAKPTSKSTTADMLNLQEAKSMLVDHQQLIPDGRFVRTPASDQVKIPKGQTVFRDVMENDMRAGEPVHTDLYTSDSYQYAYIPPWFRVRIFLFILFIWLFAAVTGVGFTIVPLIFGRRMFKVLIPAHIRTNDIYAFSIGIYILGSLGYFIFHARPMLNKLQSWTATSARAVFDRDLVHRVYKVVKRGAGLVYTYTMLLIVFPLLVTLLVELYVLMPLHTWKYSHSLDQGQEVSKLASLETLRGGHTIRVIQAWTLGILYLKLGSRSLVMVGGRPAQAVQAVLRRGWLEPDVGILTRAFVLPGLLISAVLIMSPPVVMQAILSRGLVPSEADWSREKRVFVFRMSYPLGALCWSALWALRGMVVVLDRWRALVRDEAYLMGERLHNFGGALVGSGAGNTKRSANGVGARGEWRVGVRD
ncbi:hypothetical protein BX600DRAFT_378335 [Xylariales sp. PMI_506]|nr:hypothetical protein BX600DRAFT_378335 [Xylariales sp. PMI_506]